METLAAWYYADANHQQLGPLTRAALVEAVERGAVNAATLVWRDGLAGWQPLAKVAGEVGLHGHEPPVRPRSNQPDPLRPTTSATPVS